MTPELAKSINDLALWVVAFMTSTVLPLLGVYFVKWARAKIESVKDKNTRAALEFALNRLDATAATVVTELNQTSKTLTADGKLSKADAITLLKTAYKRTCTRLPADAMDTLNASFGDRLQGVLVGKIESKVAGAK